jgi:hypothetical protein
MTAFCPVFFVAFFLISSIMNQSLYPEKKFLSSNDFNNAKTTRIGALLKKLLEKQKGVKKFEHPV